MRKNQYKTDSSTTKRMSAVRPCDTTPERIVRRVLTDLHYRYRLHRYDLPGRPDVVFAGRKKVIFVHGCFWHRHEDCPRTTTPVRNSALWQEKFQATVERDQRNKRLLSEKGWKLLVVWECEVRDLDSLRGRLQTFLTES